MEEVELGGLEDEDNDIAPVGLGEEQFSWKTRRLLFKLSKIECSSFLSQWMLSFF